MPWRDRAQLLLRGLVEIIATVTVAAIIGIALGVGISKLAGHYDSPGGRGEDPAPSQDATATSAEPAPTPSVRDVTAQDALRQVRVSVISAVLHPAATPSGQRRRRGRLSVHIKVENSGPRGVVPGRPSLLAARQRIPTRSRLGALAAWRTVDVTVRFETKGAVTEQLTTRKSGRILVARRSWPISVKVGNPANSSPRAGPSTQTAF